MGCSGSASRSPPNPGARSADRGVSKADNQISTKYQPNYYLKMLEPLPRCRSGRPAAGERMRRRCGRPESARLAACRPARIHGPAGAGARRRTAYAYRAHGCGKKIDIAIRIAYRMHAGEKKPSLQTAPALPRRRPHDFNTDTRSSRGGGDGDERADS